MTPLLFQSMILQFYREHGRHDLPWRLARTPYNAFISEVMLQQTQVERVIEKFNAFIAELPDFKSLAEAPQSQVVSLWQGLGYNRRALFLHRAAILVMEEFNGELPRSLTDLQSLPGIGPATAASIAVYAHQLPLSFIETNIRAVYIYHFFPDQEKVEDSELIPLISQTVDHADPYHWYSALMDYGARLKREKGNPSRRSAHHTSQSRFEGSLRQVRGAVLRGLHEKGGMSIEQLERTINDPEARVASVVEKLVKEGFICIDGELVSLK